MATVGVRQGMVELTEGGGGKKRNWMAGFGIECRR